MNSQRIARASAPHALLVAYLAINGFGLISSLSADTSANLTETAARQTYRYLYGYVTGNGNSVLLLVASLLLLHDRILNAWARRLSALATVVGIGQVMIVGAGFFIFERTGRNLGEIASRFAFVTACVLVSLVAWQPTRDVD
jgi:hypothetical protein